MSLGRNSGPVRKLFMQTGCPRPVALDIPWRQQPGPYSFRDTMEEAAMARSFRATMEEAARARSFRDTTCIWTMEVAARARILEILWRQQPWPVVLEILLRLQPGPGVLEILWRKHSGSVVYALCICMEYGGIS